MGVNGCGKGRDEDFFHYDIYLKLFYFYSLKLESYSLEVIFYGKEIFQRLICTAQVNLDDCGEAKY
jgi:hypothetical protein